MSEITNDLALYSYEEYSRAFEFWAAHHKSSKPDASESLIAFTKLNWARTQRLHKTIVLDPALVNAIKRVRHKYTWMVLTEAWCGDSAQSLPVIAEMAKLNPDKIRLYILLRDQNPELMDNFLTNGSRSIPKLIATDDDLATEAFTWGPRPAPAQKMFYDWKKNPRGLSWENFEKELHSWYAKDKTKAIQEEFLLLLSQLK
jgi:hypothetical protein